MSEKLQNITDIFLSLLAVIDSVKMHSSDYLDALEMVDMLILYPIIALF